MTRDPLRSALGKRLPIILVATIVIAVVATYIGMMHNAVVIDDPWVTTNNPYVQSLSGLGTLLTKDVWTGTAAGESTSLYRPLFMSSFLVNRLLFGNTPESYHFGNLLLHLGAVLLLHRLLAMLLQGKPAWIAWLVALWFAVAPLSSEPVAWISARCDPLGAVFALVAILANRRTEPRWRGAAVVCATAAALFTKESFICLPFIVLADDFLLLDRRRTDEWPKLAGLGAVVALFFLARVIVGVPSASVVAGVPLGSLLASFLYLVVSYVGRAVVPSSLDAFRPYVPLTTSACVGVMAALLVVAASLGFAARKPTAVRARTAAVGFVWFLVALAPASLTGPNLGLIGDRYAYFPLMGLCVMLAAGLDAIVARLPRRAPAAMAFVLLAGVLAQAAVTRARVREWHDEETLFRASLRDDPNNSYALYSLGAQAAQERRWPDAEDLLRRSLAREPRSFRAHNAMCVVAMNTGRLTEAETECKASLAIHGSNPRAWVNLASVYVNARAWPACEEAAAHAIEIKPQYAEAHHLRSVCLANVGRIPEAVMENGSALALDPAHAGARSFAAQLRARGLIP